MSGEALAVRLGELSQPPLLVVLASCESAREGAAVGPRLAEAGVPAVVAMQGRVSMQTVERMLPAFFGELAWDGQVDRAMAVARGAVRERHHGWMPVLYTHLRTGRIFAEPERVPVAASAPIPLFTIPDPPVDFVGRKDELEELLEVFGMGEQALRHQGAWG